MWFKNTKYRPNVAIIVTDGHGHVLLCYRADKPALLVQTVQGGIDEGETALQAARREMEEELGLKATDFKIIGSSDKKFRYDWPHGFKGMLFDKYAGQEQQFFLAKVKQDVAFALDHHHVPEFSKVEWGTPRQLLDLVWEPKRPGIENALKEFGLLGASVAA